MTSAHCHLDPNTEILDKAGTDDGSSTAGETIMSDKRTVVVIVGGGFGGPAAARALKHAPVNVVLIDRVNHHLFQPLLYLVATSVLAPGQIASPIRSILRKSRNTTFVLGTVTAVDAASRRVIVETQDRTGVRLSYDYLILATGQPTVTLATMNTSSMLPA
jgi:NADH dehydrogenase